MYIKSKLFKTICISIITLFANTVFIPAGFSQPQILLNLPGPNQFVPLSNSYSFPILKGIKLNPDNPLQIDFIIDTGDTGRKLDQAEQKIFSITNSRISSWR